MTHPPHHEPDWPPLPRPHIEPPQHKISPAVLVLIFVGAAIVVLAGVIVTLGVYADSSNSAAPGASPKPTTPERAKDACAEDSDGVTIGDAGKSMTIDNARPYGERATFDEVFCILEVLKTPDAVISQIEDTRALDGRQEADWGDGKFSASWTYHPDDGLNIIIEEK